MTTMVANSLPNPMAGMDIAAGTPALLVDQVSKVFTSRSGIVTRLRGGPKSS